MGTVLPQHQAFDVSVDVQPQSGSKCFDDDGRLKRTGKFYFFTGLWKCQVEFSYAFGPELM